MRSLFVILSFVAGFLTCHFFLKPEVEERVKYIETVVTSTTYKKLYEELKFEVDNFEDLSDSVEYYQERYRKELGNVKIVHDSVFVENSFSAPLRRYRGLEVSLFGDTHYNALVAGKLLDITITNDFSIPQITNTITKETNRTIIRNPKGVYGVGGIGSDFTYSVGAMYLNDKSLFGYSYQPQTGIHSINAGFKVF